MAVAHGDAHAERHTGRNQSGAQDVAKAPRVAKMARARRSPTAAPGEFVEGMPETYPAYPAESAVAGAIGPVIMGIAQRIGLLSEQNILNEKAA